MTKIYGIIPARMSSSRFPGKPLYPICNRPMLEHVYLRANKFARFTKLLLATCDKEIAKFAGNRNIPYIMTSDQHVRCLDRVGEAIQKYDPKISDNDIVVCVQGDEPMLHPEMIATVIQPLEEDKNIPCTVLALPIKEAQQFHNPDTVKIVHDMRGDVLYTSRSPVPYSKTFNDSIQAKRIFGILAFRWHFLQTFNQLPESPLEKQEACDSNRILDHGFKQRIAVYPYQAFFSVDSPSDIQLVESHIEKDVLWGSY